MSINPKSAAAIGAIICVAYAVLHTMGFSINGLRLSTTDALLFAVALSLIGS